MKQKQKEDGSLESISRNGRRPMWAAAWTAIRKRRNNIKIKLKKRRAH
jgi:O-antigen ligase